MNEDDRFFRAMGKIVCVYSFLVVMVLVGYALVQLYQADQSYLYDATPLLAPDSTGKKVK